MTPLPHGASLTRAHCGQSRRGPIRSRERGHSVDRVRVECTKVPGDPLSAQFENAVIPLLEPLHRQALRLTSNRVDAEDLVQETVLNAYAGLRAFEQGTNFKAWLRRIMTNTYISSYRKQKRRPAQHPTGDITDRQLVDSAPRTAGGLQSAEDQALELLPDPYLKAAMMVLPEQFRIAVYFADIAGYSYKEIAAMTDTRQGTVSSRLNRGRKQLRDLLSDSPVNHAGRTFERGPSGSTQRRARVDGASVAAVSPAAPVSDGPGQPRR
jgi:RNA polymerase sigma-70 factor (TIGR02947 family)